MEKNPSMFQKGDTYPLEQVSWDDAKKFIAKLNKEHSDKSFQLPAGAEFRLPTEAEWEYACRANNPGNYCGGNDVDAVAWYGEGLNGSTHPVGEKKANGFGLHDMSGNLWEWCSDWYTEDYYASRPDKEKNPLGSPSGSGHVIRGGGWGDASEYVRATVRDRCAADFRGNLVGFRLVLSSPATDLEFP
jgi:formylglycine-generating enzyme required for sulfatase activity